MGKWTVRIPIDITVEAADKGDALQKTLLVAREVDMKSGGRANVALWPTPTKLEEIEE